MNRRLQGRTAIVTGASRGLGRATALALAAEGAAVAVVARTEQMWNNRLPGTIGETVAEIVAGGGRAVAVRADLTDRDDLPRLVEQARGALGPITILVNNAAFTAPGRPPEPGAVAPGKPPKPGAVAPGRPPKPGAVASGKLEKSAGSQAPQADWPPFVGTPGHAFRRHFEIAVFAAYDLMQLVVPDMIDEGRGAIVNVSSIASRIPGDGPYRDFAGGILPGYGGSKAALEHLTSSAAYELQRRNIAVNALSPSQPMMTPGLSYYRTDFDDIGSEAEFAEAVVRLSLVDPGVVTGRTIGHREVLDGSFAPFVP